MFTIELRATEAIIIGRKQLTTAWKVFGEAPTQKQAEMDVSWLINETKDFLSDLDRPVAVEYRILGNSGELVTSNKI